MYSSVTVPSLSFKKWQKCVVISEINNKTRGNPHVLHAVSVNNRWNIIICNNFSTNLFFSVEIRFLFSSNVPQDEITRS